MINQLIVIVHVFAGGFAPRTGIVRCAFAKSLLNVTFVHVDVWLVGVYVLGNVSVTTISSASNPHSLTITS